MTQTPFYHQVKEWAPAYLEGLSCPRALTVLILLRSGEWAQLASLSLNPSDYPTADAYYLAACASELFRKCADFPTSSSRRAEVALENFWVAERQCFRTNRRLYPYVDRTGDCERISGFIARVRKKIRTWLGPLPRDVFGRFGPGSTYGDTGAFTTVPDKMSTRPTTTSRDVPFTFRWEESAWARALHYTPRYAQKIVKGNRFTTVPKDSLKDRGICIEPSLNVFYQLGVGAALRGRLLSAGIDLQHGQNHHRQFACDASKDGSFCTVDLSNASDTVSRSIVELLLPAEWFSLLDMLRSPFTLVPHKGTKSWVRLEKFSSMGNGFTFELETLLFLGLAAQAMEDSGLTPMPGVNLLVYGDDIIAPTSCSEVLLSVLSFFGFTPNARKTFVEGPFRESCGGDFFSGVPVRAFYCKELPTNDAERFSLANGLRSVMVQLAGRHCGDHRLLLRAWHAVVNSIALPNRSCRGPTDLGDIVIHDAFEFWSIKKKDDIRYVRTLRPINRSVGFGHFRSSSLLAYASYIAGSRKDSGLLDGVPTRDSVSGYRLGWTAYS